MNIPDNEQEWRKHAIAENCKCVACGELISFEDRQIYMDRRLCSYCAKMIAPKDYEATK